MYPEPGRPGCGSHQDRTARRGRRHARLGPPYLKDAAGNDTTEAAYYLSANRNKLSVALDIATPRGAELVRELAQQCDILVENFKVGGLRKYGLDYESVKAINPRLIYCSITGFGQTGPYASRPATIS